MYRSQCEALQHPYGNKEEVFSFLHAREIERNLVYFLEVDYNSGLFIAVCQSNSVLSPKTLRQLWNK